MPHTDDSALLSRITTDTEICHGKPCIRGKRYPVETMLEYLAGGSTQAELIEEFPDLVEADLRACIAYARRALTARSQHLALA